MERNIESRNDVGDHIHVEFPDTDIAGGHESEEAAYGNALPVPYGHALGIILDRLGDTYLDRGSDAAL